MRTSTFAMVALVCLLSARSSPADTLLHANLDGLQEVPSNSSPGLGSADFTLHPDNTLDYVVNYQDMLATLTVAHMHVSSGPGSNGPVVFALAVNGPATGNFSGTVGPLTIVQANDLLAGNHYVNLKSMAHPGGEIRGQITLIPEPASIVLGLFAAAGLITVAIRRKSRRTTFFSEPS